MSTLKTFIVSYKQDEKSPTEIFKCEAEDIEHAKEQIINYISYVIIINVNGVSSEFNI